MPDSETYSAGAKAGIAVVSGGSVIAIALANIHHPEVLAVTLIGIVVALGIVFGYAWAAKWWSQRKGGASISKELEDDARNLPIRASGESQARAQEMRAKFLSGLNILGPELYAYPWYLVVGERSGGKTFLIERGTRDIRSGDEVPGLGGTINMNWWFTESAVFLDTAGTLMMPEIDTGTNELWEGFLKMLGSKRRDCPINGIILVIPADTLQTDSEEKVDENARKIANELGKVRRLFQMRFPIFVVVTKCDKIIGFREFFEVLSDDAQMLGWSNPDLDAPFDPSKLTEHFASVRAALVKRRFHLLRNPIVQSNAGALRLNEVDALYEFPDRIAKMSERLQRYIRPIFARGAGSPKPLFFRGVYFTSSLQQGTAVDIALATILGKSPQDLKMINTGDADTISQRSLFVGDTFKKKILLESRLVTREDSVKRLNRRRRVQMLSAAMAACLVLIGATTYQKIDLRNRIESHEELWSALNPQSERPVDFAIITDGGKYRGNAKPLVGAEVTPAMPAMADKTILELHRAAQEDLERPFDPPIIFWFSNRVADKDYVPQKIAAYRSFVQRSVLFPLERAELKTLNDPKTWKNSDAALHSLANLIRLRWPSASATTESTTVPGESELAAMLADVQHAGDPDLSLGDADQAVIVNGYHHLVTTHNVRFDGEPTLEVEIRKIVQDRFLAQWNSAKDQRHGLQEAASSLSRDLNQFEEAARSLVALIPWDGKPLQDNQKIAAFLDKWTTATVQLEQANHDIADDLRATGWQKVESFSKFYSANTVGLPQARQAACQQLLDAIGSGSELPEVRKQLKQEVAEAQNELADQAQDSTVQELLKQDWLLTAVNDSASSNSPSLAFQVDFEILEQGRQFAKLDTPAPLLSDQLQAIDDAARDSRETVARDTSLLKRQSVDRIDKLADFATLAIDMAARQQRQQRVEEALKQWPSDDQQLRTLVRNQPLAADDHEIQFGDLPVAHLQQKSPPHEYHPARMRRLLASANDIEQAIHSNAERIAFIDAKALTDQSKLLGQAVNRLKADFDRYWKETVVQFSVDPVSWPKDSDQIRKLAAPDALQRTVDDLAVVDQWRQRAIGPEQPSATQPSDVAVITKLVRNWATLASDPNLRQRLLGEKWTDFKTALIFVRSGQDSVADRFWDAFFSHAMEDTATYFSRQTDEAYRNLTSIASKFPLNPDLSAQDISLDELRAAGNIAASIIGGTESVPGALREPNDLALQSLPDDVRSSVDKFRSGGLTDSQTHWVIQIKGLSDLLTKSPLEYGIEAVDLPYNQAQLPLPWYAERLECGMTVGRNGVDCGNHAGVTILVKQSVLVSGQDAALPDRRFIDANTGPKDVIFQLFTNGRADFDGQFLLARGQWAPLRLATKSNATWDAKRQAYLYDQVLTALPSPNPEKYRICLLIHFYRANAPTAGLALDLPDNPPEVVSHLP